MLSEMAFNVGVLHQPLPFRLLQRKALDDVLAAYLDLVDEFNTPASGQVLAGSGESNH